MAAAGEPIPFGISVTGIIGAVAGLVTALALVLAALPALIKTLNKIKDVEEKVDGVHVLVNQQHTDAQNYQRALIAALKEAGVKVPDDQSAPPPEPPV
jgi:hypothetical protein